MAGEAFGGCFGVSVAVWSLLLYRGMWCSLVGMCEFPEVLVMVIKMAAGHCVACRQAVDVGMEAH